MERHTGTTKKTNNSMTIKRFFFRTVIRTLEAMNHHHSPKHCRNHNLELSPLPTGNEHLDLITVAFNNDTILKLHIVKVAQHITCPHTHFIADNSTDMECSHRIEEYCREVGVPYIRLPKNRLGKIGPSYSHATALGWVYKYIVGSRKPHYFGFLDHDLFPLVDTDPTAILHSQPVYGPKRERDKYWYLSAIMSFYDYSYTSSRKVDFMPVTYTGTYLDTGGGNWPSLLSTLDVSQLQFCKERLEKIGTEGGDNRHQDLVEIFDERWLHTINGSYWKKVAIKKENLLDDLIDRYSRELKG